MIRLLRIETAFRNRASRPVALLAGIGVLFAVAACGGDKESSVAKGTASYSSPEGDRTVEVDAVETDGDVGGTVTVDDDGGRWSIDIRCSGTVEGTLVLAGDVASGSPKAGTHAALFVRQAEPDRVAVWFEDPPPAKTCEDFVAAIPPGVTEALLPVAGDIEQG